MRRTVAATRHRVVIERLTKRGTRVPVIEITPHGDIRETDVPAMRTSIREILTHQMSDMHLHPNSGAIEGYRRISLLVAEVDRRIAAKRHLNQQRRARQAATLATA